VSDRDFVLYVGRSPEAVGFSTLSRKEAGEDGTFLALISPRNEVSGEEVAPKDVVYVLDTSGSMRGEKIEQAKKALDIGIGLLREKDRFSVIGFATAVTSFREGLSDATPQAKAAVVQWVNGLVATGGTNIEGALAEALRARDD